MKVESNLYKTEIKRSKKKIKHLKHKKKKETININSHNFIMNEAEKLGFYTKDLFILLAKQRIFARWQIKNQKHSRKFHSYFIVFEKSNKKVRFI